MTLISERTPTDTCIGRTCLKWAADGSLSPFDRNLLMRRLCAADPEFAKSEACTIHNREE